MDRSGFMMQWRMGRRSLWTLALLALALFVPTPSWAQFPAQDIKSQEPMPSLLFTAASAPVTLSNGTGDGSVQITVDGYGSFGSSTPAGRAIYDPVGFRGPASTVFESGVYFSPLANFLTTDSFGAQLPPIDFIAQGSDFVQSRFDVAGFHFELTQRLNPIGSRGSSFAQTYRITNNTGTVQTFKAVRHVDGDLLFDGTLVDFGGVTPNGRTLFEFDSGDDPTAPTTFVGITAEGGTPTGFTIQRFRFTDNIRAAHGIPASVLDQVAGDGGDADRITDSGYDVTLSLQNEFTLAPGETVTYLTTTLFGEGSTGSLGLEIVDPACKSRTECGGDFLETNGSLKADINELAKAVVRRDGVATDGVTQLLLRVQSDTPVTFTLKDPGGSIPFDIHPCQWGTLTDRHGSSPSCGSIQITPEATRTLGNVAFAVYRAPLNFPLASAAAPTGVTIRASTSSATAIGPLELIPPPVLLVHGVWSGPDAWHQTLRPNGSTGFVEALQNAGFNADITVTSALVDHSDIDGSAGSFDPRSTSKVIERLIAKTNTIRARVRGTDTNGFAVTQVDVVGHSMGGLIARARTVYSGSPYKRRDNYNQGDFHKIITIGSPHQGTELANRLIRYNQRRTAGWKCGVDGTCDVGDTLAQFFTELKKPLKQAVLDFQTGSRAIRRFGVTTVPSHAIVGIAPSDPAIEGDLNTVIRDIIRLSFTVDSALGGNGNHDTIVSFDSQKGDLPGTASCGVVDVGAVSCIQDIVHAKGEDGWFTSDTGETESQDVFDRVKYLLLHRVDSDVFGKFAALPDGGEYKTLDEPCNRDGSTAASALSAVATATTSADITINPPSGTLVHTGNPVLIQFNVTGGNPVNGVLFAVNGGLRTIEGPPPYTFEYTAPSDRAGRIDITALTFGPGPENYAADTYVIVQPSAVPTLISASPSTETLLQIGHSFTIQVVGEFANGSQIDLTSSVAGTIYSTLSGNNNVISVTPEGVVKAQGSGQDTVLIGNSGKSTAVLVNVTITNTGSGTAKLGVFRNGDWFLDLNGNALWDGCGTDGCLLGWGMAGDLPVAGRW